MATEIERKFLVERAKLPQLQDGKNILQGYIPTNNSASVRVRIADDLAFLTLKGATTGISRLEFEYAIPVTDARQIMDKMCENNFIEKIRYTVFHRNHVWEIDVFAGKNAGLVVAEVELKDENDDVDLPDWVAEEVTGDPRYYNQQLMKHPFQDW